MKIPKHTPKYAVFYTEEIHEFGRDDRWLIVSADPEKFNTLNACGDWIAESKCRAVAMQICHAANTGVYLPETEFDHSESKGLGTEKSANPFQPKLRDESSGRENSEEELLAALKELTDYIERSPALKPAFNNPWTDSCRIFNDATRAIAKTEGRT